VRNANREERGNKVRLSKLGEARDVRLMDSCGGSGYRIEEDCFGLWLKRLRRMERTIGEADFLLARFHNI
jgi:hypothetical protein